MNETRLRRLIQMVEESEIESLEIRRWFQTIRIIKRLNNHNGSAPAVHATRMETVIPVATAPAPVPAAPAASPAPQPAATPVAETPSNLIEIKAPMVGTFYRAPAPGAAPFVDVDKRISPGDTLCIIEAMKLMNEIEAEQSGRIAKVLIEDGQPIEFGQALFLLDPTG